MWAEMLLGVAVATLIGVSFVGGCFCGSYVQRTIGYVIKTRAEKELLDQAAEREERSYEDRRIGQYQASRTVKAAEALENVSRSSSNSPLGASIPSPDDLDGLLDANPHDFTKNLSTEKMREAMRRGQ